MIKSLLCKIGWHSYFVGFDKTFNDGCSDHARCKWCGVEGMIDSTGALFSRAASPTESGK